MIRKTLTIIFIALLALIALAFAVPFAFRGKITALIKKEINKSLDAKVDFSAVDISFFRHFPKVALSLNNLQVTGKGSFAADTLFAAPAIDVAVNIMSLFRGDGFTIYSIRLNEPRIHAIVSQAGKANWDIVKPDTAAASPSKESKPFRLHLQSYAISNGYISYEDSTSGISSEIAGLNHSGSGDFASELFTLSTQTRAAAVSFSYGGIPYMSGIATGIDADFRIDNTSKTYSFKTDNISLNALKLSARGDFKQVNDSVYHMDISYNAPSTDFKNILSLVPVIYQKDFASIKTGGQALFNGFVKGDYGNKQVPAYQLNLEVKDGFFQYPDLPRPVKNIQLAAKINNPDGVPDHTVVDIPRAHIEMDNDPFDMRLLLKNPVTDMFIDAAASGRLDLSKIAQLVKLQAGTRLAGLLNADIHASGNLSAVEKKQYEKFNAGGTLNLDHFLYASKAYPDAVELSTLQTAFNPHNVTISNLAGQYKKTRFTANGQINNLLPYMLQHRALNGLLNVKADQLNLNDWTGSSGEQQPAGNAAPATPFAVPANLDIIINAGVDKVHYDKIDMQQLSGMLTIKDEKISLNNIRSNLLQGSMTVNGSYATKQNKKKPDISLNYDVHGFDVAQTFNAFNTAQALMPVGKFISGKLQSQLSFTGTLGQNMMPDLASLTGNGNLLLIEGLLQKFAPLEKLAALVNVKALESFTLKDLKTYIMFSNGKVQVKPFTLKTNGVEMEIGGMHGFDQSLDYTINMKIPRALMGSQGNALVNDLAGQLSSKGIPVKLGDIVNLAVHMGGNITHPVLKADLRQTAGSLADNLKQQAADFAKAKLDSTRKTVGGAVKDTIASIKKQAVQSAGDAIKKQILGKQDSSQPGRPGESAGGLLRDLNPFKRKNKPDSAHKP